MKLSDLHQVELLGKRRGELLGKLAICTQPSRGLNVLIQSTYQDDALIEAVRPAVLAELNARLAAIDAELLALGVDIESAAGSNQP